MGLRKTPAEEAELAELQQLEQDAPSQPEEPAPTLEDVAFVAAGPDAADAARAARRTLAGAWGTVALVLDQNGDPVFAEAVDGNQASALEYARRSADLRIEDDLRPFAVRCTADSALVSTIVRF